MIRTFLAAILLSIVTTAAAADTVKISCKEYARLTGDNLCDLFPELKMSRKEYEATVRRFKKKTCLAEWEKKYGHCPPANALWSDPPPECVGHTPAECDQPVDTPQPRVDPNAKLWD